MSASYPLTRHLGGGSSGSAPLRLLSPTRSDAATDPYWLTDQMLFHYQRCPRRAFLDRYGDRSLRDAPSDYLQKLKQDSADHRKQILADYQPLHSPHYPFRDWRAGAIATAALMQQGVDYIGQGVLIAETATNVVLVSNPDLLIRMPGESIWGDWQYIPADIKFGKKPKLDYQMVAAFHALVLMDGQGTWPAASWLILREGKSYAIDLDKQLTRLDELLYACIEDLQDSEPPEVFIAHSRCDLCHWFSQCHSQAKATKHLSLLPGVTPARYVHLQRLQLTTVAALATARPEQLSSLPGFGEQVAEKIVHQAQSVLNDTAIARVSVHTARFPLTPETLPSAAVELYFDIEAAPDKQLIYLHGVLVVDKVANTETFHPLLAEHPEQEAEAWTAFVMLMQQHPTAPVYHFCPYEAQTVRRLAAEFGLPEGADVDRLLDRFVDVHKCFTDAVTLPTESYALKHIARWIGFDWRDADANGAQSICWYDDWLTTGDRQYLTAILRYNEDDCRATYQIKEWLVNFAQPFWDQDGGDDVDARADGV
ncbi:MAG: TM0106 family RecB-like putative nuclease [Cyanobacteria bacterium P01_A01_bin.123]